MRYEMKERETGDAAAGQGSFNVLIAISAKYN